MKKKLVVVAMLLFAVCFAGFAQGAFSAEPSQYVAKAEEEKEYTFIVSGELLARNSPDWFFRRDRFVIIAKSLKGAERMAKNKFTNKYIYIGYSDAENLGRIRGFTIECESVRNACDYDLKF